jgi:hypothetical protein
MMHLSKCHPQSWRRGVWTCPAPAPCFPACPTYLSFACWQLKAGHPLVMSRLAKAGTSTATHFMACRDPLLVPRGFLAARKDPFLRQEASKVGRQRHELWFLWTLDSVNLQLLSTPLRCSRRILLQDSRLKSLFCPTLRQFARRKHDASPDAGRQDNQIPSADHFPAAKKEAKKGQGSADHCHTIGPTLVPDSRFQASLKVALCPLSYCLGPRITGGNNSTVFPQDRALRTTMR